MVSGSFSKIILVILLGVFIAVLGSSAVYSANSDDFCDSYAELYPIICQYIPPETLGEVISSEPDVSVEPEENPDSGADAQNDPLLSLPECSIETKLTRPPLNNDDYSAISPLGNINPPGHTIPSDHIGIDITKVNEFDMVSANIHAPGDIRILEVSYTTYFTDGVIQSIDYNVAFAPCRDQILEFGHVATISTELLEILNSTEVWCWDKYGIEPFTAQRCEISLALDVEVGTILGTAGGNFTGTFGIDFWAYDMWTL